MVKAGMPANLLKKAGHALKRALLPSYVTCGRGADIDFSVKFRRHHGTIAIGDEVRLLRGGEILAPVTIGEDTFINRDVYIRAETVIGKNVNIGPFVRLVTDSHTIGTHTRRAGANVFYPIAIEDGVWIGAGAIVIGPVTLGRGCIVGAGAIVVKDVPPDCVYAGNPARLLRKLDRLADGATAQ